MSPEEFKHLREGDIVRHVGGHDGWIVTANWGNAGVEIVRTNLIHNPTEWIKICPECNQPTDR